jgi:hypothetical protein
MAALASSAVAVVERWTEGGLNSRKYVVKKVTLTLTGQGTATNKITATVLGFKKIVDASPLVKSDDSEIILATPSYDGSFLLLNAGGTTAPADETGTFTCQVRGLAL